MVHHNNTNSVYQFFLTTEAPGFAKATTRQAESTELDFLFLWRETAPKEKQLPLRGTLWNRSSCLPAGLGVFIGSSPARHRPPGADSGEAGGSPDPIEKSDSASSVTLWFKAINEVSLFNFSFTTEALRALS